MTRVIPVGNHMFLYLDMFLLIRYFSEISKHSTLAMYVPNSGRVVYLTKITAVLF